MVGNMVCRLIPLIGHVQQTSLNLIEQLIRLYMKNVQRSHEKMLEDSIQKIVYEKYFKYKH